MTKTFHHKIAVVFLVLLTLAAASIFLKHWYIPCVFMGIYVIFGFTLSKDQWNSETFANSVYYMGFILTLLSLFVALNRDSFADPYSIFKYMALAMSTTIFGMAVRVVLIQFRRTLPDTAEEVGDEIEVLAEELRTYIRKTTEDFKKLSQEVDAGLRQSVQVFGEMSSQANGAVKESSEQLRTTLNSMAAEQRKAMEEQVRESAIIFGDTVNALKRSLESSEINTVIKNTTTIIVSKSIEALNDYKQGIDVAVQGVLTSFKEMEGTIKQTVKGISISDGKINKIRESIERLDTVYTNAISIFAAKIADIDVSAHLLPTIEDMKKNLQEINEHVIGILKETNKDIDKLLQGIQERQRKTIGVYEDIETVGKLLESMTELKLHAGTCALGFEELSTKIKDLDGKVVMLPPSVNEAANQIEKIQRDVVATTEGFSKKINQSLAVINADSIKITEVNNSLKSTLAESIDFLKTKLDEN